jgi:hypothetical protein
MEWMQSHEAVLWWLAATSVLLFVATAIAVPMFLLRIPADYYARPTHPTSFFADSHPIPRALLRAGKNALGFVLVLTGIFMLVLPGQGLLTIIAGMMLLDFPGKQRLERWLVRRPLVLRSINWLRERNKRPPLVAE